MKTKFLGILLIFTILFTCTAAASDFHISQAKDAQKKGYISADSVKFYTKELAMQKAHKSSYGSFADYDVHYAYQLNLLGLLPVSGNGYELGKPLTKSQGIIMIIRILGKEAEVKSGKYSHPFTDVPTWASKYIGYAYKNGLIPKTSSKKFGFNQNMSFNEYTSLLLRALGYKANIDFTQKNLIDKAEVMGFPVKYAARKYYLRAYMVEMTRMALDLSIKGTTKLLKTQLIEKKVISKEKLKYVEEQQYQYYFSVVKDLQTEVMWKYSKMYDFIEYMDSRNMPVPIQGSTYGWPDKGIELEYSGEIEIKNKGHKQEVYDSILKNILIDLKFYETQVDYRLKEFKETGLCLFSQYPTRIIEVKKLSDGIRLKFYIDK